MSPLIITKYKKDLVNIFPSYVGKVFSVSFFEWRIGMYRIKNIEIKKRRWIFLGIVWALILTILPISKIQVRAEETIIRVGYDTNSNFIQNDGYEYYGYGVEYLEKIAEYTGWEYEYVEDESWHGSLDKLRNGEIDLLCTVHYTRDRAREFLFSSIPLGYETSLLYSMPDSTISYQDFEEMQGCKIGLL